MFNSWRACVYRISSRVRGLARPPWLGLGCRFVVRWIYLGAKAWRPRRGDLSCTDRGRFFVDVVYHYCVAVSNESVLPSPSVKGLASIMHTGATDEGTQNFRTAGTLRPILQWATASVA